jgi:peroxiredoxin
MASEDLTGEIKNAVLAALEADGSLSERLALIAERARRERPEFAAAIDRLVARLKEAGAGDAAPKIGDALPSFLLPDERGTLVSLDDLLAKGPVAICFHRGHWCPYCRLNFLALAKAQPQIAAAGGQIAAIIPERWRFTAALKAQAGAAFPVLTDMDNGYAMSLNIAIWLGPEMEKFIAGRGHDLPAYQGNKSWIVPIPATFVVGTDGVIVARYLDPDYRHRMGIEDLESSMRRAAT